MHRIRTTNLVFGIVLLLIRLSPAHGEEPIQIGTIFGLSGDVAPYGVWASNGVAIAAEKLNEAGGINGRPIDIVGEDGHGKPADSVTAYRRLRESYKIEFLLTHSSSVALAIAPLTNADHVVQIDVSASTPAYSSPNDFTFRTGILATQLAGDMADALSKRFGVNRIAVFYIDNDKGLSGYESFRNRFQGKIAVAESFRESEVDYRPLLLKARAKKVKDIWISGHLKETGLLLKQSASSGMQFRFFSDVYSVEGTEFLTAAGTAAEGTIYIAPRFDSLSDPTATDFNARYQRKFRETPNYFAAQSFDAVIALAEAGKSCAAVNSICVKDALYAVDLNGASGRIRFDVNGDVTKGTEVKIVEKGKFISLN